MNNLTTGNRKCKEEKYLGDDFEIVDAQGNVYDLGGRELVSICRCGLSSNKPFCDGSHKGHFEHVAEAFALPPRKV